MRILLLAIAILFSGRFTLAQKQLITDFESWETLAGWPGIEEPVGWTTLNPYEAKQNRRAVNKSTYAVQGNYALEVLPVFYNSDTNRISQAILGRGNFIDSNTKEFTWWGTGIRLKSFILYGYFRFVPDSNFDDSAWIEVFQRRGDHNGYFGSFTFYPNQAYQNFRVGLWGFPTSDADTFSIALFYRTSDTSANPNGRLWIDFLSTYNPNSTQDLHKSFIHIYPNPNSTNQLYINFPEQVSFSDKIEIAFYNAMGQQVKILKGSQEELKEINIGQLPQGCYVVEVKTAEGFTSRNRLLYQPAH